MKQIWVIDDEPSICWALRKELEQAGYAVEVFGSAEACLERISNARSYPNVVLLDVRLPGMSGLELLGHLQGLPSQPAVIVMTAFGDLKVAVEAVRGRAFEYLTKPFDLSGVLNLVERAARSATPTVSLAANYAGAKPEHDTMLGDSPAMQRVYKQIAIAAQSDTPVLIDGESGTGKSLVARMIHRFSNRATQPLVFFRPDADHITESDAELFGTCLPSSIAVAASAVSGSTGVVGLGPNKQQGLMLLSGQGTLVIDEVVELSIAAQAKLLGAIEAGSFQAVSSAESDPFQARLLFTSSVDLEGACNDGALYEPLAAQMRVINIQLPPLRERREDIRGLAHAFLAMVAPGAGKRLSNLAIESLQSQSWPGNVRQLKQAVQYAAVHARGGIVNPEDLPVLEGQPTDRSVHGSTAENLEQATRSWLQAQCREGDRSAGDSDMISGFLHEHFLAIAERALIQAMLEECGGNRAAVASRLGLHRTTLRQKMKRYGL
jgi:two-component system nitrogen regulation response regulator GlnG